MSFSAFTQKDYEWIARDYELLHAAAEKRCANADELAAVVALMPECDHWAYDGSYLPYDPYATEDGATDATDGTDPDEGDGHTFFGNVFGGGSGYYPYRITEGGEGVGTTHNVWFPFQGRVRGNTYLIITDGHILTSAYGGCEYADVVGDCHVVMSGGTLGLPRSVAGMKAHPVTCYLFGTPLIRALRMDIVVAARIVLSTVRLPTTKRA